MSCFRYGVKCKNMKLMGISILLPQYLYNRFQLINRKPYWVEESESN